MPHVSSRRTGAPHPGFPVEFVGVDELYAAFLNESRTRGCCLVPRTGNPGISLVFREMWDSTALPLTSWTPISCCGLFKQTALNTKIFETALIGSASF